MPTNFTPPRLYFTNNQLFTNDNELLVEIRKGNQSAFKFLYQRYAPRLKQFAYRYTQNRVVAEDIVQECFLKFWEKRDFLTNISLTSLLFAMVRNACLNYLKHESLIEIEHISNFQMREGEELLYHSDFHYTPEDILLYEELQKEIRNILERLPERCREVFIMSRFQGLKNREIAERLAISTTAVEKHISKALQYFSAHFKRDYPQSLSILATVWIYLS